MTTTYEMGNIVKKIKKVDLKKRNYFQTPKWLMKLFIKKILSSKAFKMYILMYDRTKLSAKNNWVDKDGYVYIKYSYEEFLVDLMVSSKSTVASGIKELESLELLERKRNFNGGNIYYLGILDDEDDDGEKGSYACVERKKKSSKKRDKKGERDSTIKCTKSGTEIDNSQSAKECTFQGTKTCTYQSTQKLYSNNNDISNNNIVKTTKSNNEISSLDILNFLVENNIGIQTMDNILHLKNVDYQRIIDVVNYGKKKGWGEGAIYQALRDDWVIEVEPEISPQELEEKRRWLNYFAGVDKLTRRELLDTIKVIPIEELNRNKSELRRMSVDMFKSFLVRLAKIYRNKMGR